MPRRKESNNSDRDSLTSKEFVDIDAATDRFFDAKSVAAAQPAIVILVGGICSGKTTFRREQYPDGFVVLDAAEIFRLLYPDEEYVFSEEFDDLINLVGNVVAARAIKERRNIVTEMIGADSDAMMSVIDGMKQAGYKVDAVLVDCDRELAWERHERRNDDSLSAYYTESYHQRWLLTAVNQQPRH